MTKIELLAPAGNRQSLIGAINAGANAIYLAGKKFGARAFADNFNIDEIREVVRYAHLRKVKIYITINTLVFDDEIKELLEYTDELVNLNVDGLIVQDLGVLDIFISRYPDTEIHVSTQMNIMNVEQVMFLKSLGVNRIILARETSIDTIKEIKQKVDIELEVFVHGALCVSYSGNCLFSSMIGGRSGNRGECAQPCRLPYTLMKEDQIVNEDSYLMSTKDLMTINYLNELIEAGVDSFKIEGRMRKPEYVIQTVLSYRKAIDSYLLNRTFDVENEIINLKKVFNREYTDGYLLNIKPKTINNAHRPNHMGIEVGKVIDFNFGKVKIELKDTMQAGDGIRFVGNRDFGLGVSRILLNGNPIKRAFKNDIIEIDSPEKIDIESIVYKTLDSDLENDLQKFLDENYKLISLSGKVYATTNEAISIEVQDQNNNKLYRTSSYNIVPATNKPTTKKEIVDQFSKLGNTPFEWKELEVSTDNLGFIPVKIMNELRRQIIEDISAKYLERTKPNINTSTIKSADSIYQEATQLVCYVRTIDQYEAACSANIETIYVDDDLYQRNPQYNFKKTVIKKRRIWRNTDNNKNINTQVVSDLSHLVKNDKNQSIISDEFFNVTNIYSANFLFKNGVKRVAFSPEMTKVRLEMFKKNFFDEFNREPNLEKIVYGHEELMISKYCPIAKTYDTNIGCNICYQNQYYLKDRFNAKYPLINDGICNVKIMHSKPLNLIDYVQPIIKFGINTLRLNFSVEDYDTTLNVIRNFQNAINNKDYYLSRENVTTGRFLR